MKYQGNLYGMQFIEKMDKETTIEKGLIDAKENDIILISDVDEIPNLTNINIKRS